MVSYLYEQHKKGKHLDPRLVNEAISDAFPNQELDVASINEMQSQVNETTFFTTNQIQLEKSPDEKYKLYANQVQKPSSQDSAQRAIKEYQEYAETRFLDIKANETVVSYKDWLLGKKLALKTVQKKLAHVKTWLSKGHNYTVFTNFFKGREELVRPHEAYPEEDILELTQVLQDKAESFAADSN